MSEQRPDRCPLCGGPNDCGLAAGKSECWCFEAKISPEALAQVPEGAKGKVCVCAACARSHGHTALSGTGSDIIAGMEPPVLPISEPGLRARTPAHRRIPECIALLSPDSKATVDPDFAKDVAAGIAAHRESLEPPSSE